MRLTQWIVPTALLVSTAGCSSMMAQNYSGNQPHGSAGSTCTLPDQQAGGPTLDTALEQLVDLVPTTSTGIVNAQSKTRDLTNGALFGFDTTYKQSNIDLLWIEMAYKTLDGNNNVWFSYGNTTNTLTNDPNASEFAMLGTSVILSRGLLTLASLAADNQLANKGPTSGTVAITNMLASMEAMVNDTSGASPLIPVTYTNMYLMNLTDRILMDQVLNSQGYSSTAFVASPVYPADNNATQDLPIAEKLLVAYLSNTQSHGIQQIGIHEFDSPTYSGVQMESLVEGLRLAADANIVKDYQTALDYLWLDLAANFFPGNIRIGGPFSRDYDFMAGQGNLQSWIEVVGCWTTGQLVEGGVTYPGTGLITASGLTLEAAELYDMFYGPVPSYQLEDSTYALATTVGSPASGTYIQREVYQGWGTETNGTAAPVRSDSIFDNVTIGCSSGNYGPQDKMFVAGLTGQASSGLNNRSMALISDVLDSSGNPYGTATTVDGDNEAKPEHLQENMACAPATGAAMLSMNINGTLRDSADNGLSTNILFPFDTAYTAANGGTNPTYPIVEINGVSLNTILSSTAVLPNNGCAAANGATTVAAGATTPPYIIYCDLTMGTSYVTLVGKSSSSMTGGVVGIKFLQNDWKDQNMNADASTEQIAGGTNYRLEIDFNGSIPNPTGMSNSVSRIAVIHSNVPKADEPQGYTVPSQLFVTALVVTDDNPGSPITADRVNGILSHVTYTQVPNSPVTGESTFAVSFPKGYQPFTPSAPSNFLTGLQVVRSTTATLTDIGTETYSSNNNGTPYTGSTWPSSGCTYPTLYGVTATGAITCYADAFWAESSHVILNP